MVVKKKQMSLFLSLLVMLLCLSFHVPTTEARLRHVVRIPVSASVSTPPSKDCGSGIYNVNVATEAPCRRPTRPPGANH
ncbi:hypothetical protein CARUB_v10021243mg [Capsella rubella]|uniref:Transmembrane protein n=1 Tax=Capsella rubella TaxID=81985 RepID=R0I1B2_9BRAS|nr:hypothetical protein CARUB_v10021243mg [Capsella rubella]